MTASSIHTVKEKTSSVLLLELSLLSIIDLISKKAIHNYFLFQGGDGKRDSEEKEYTHKLLAVVHKGQKSPTPAIFN